MNWSEKIGLEPEAQILLLVSLEIGAPIAHPEPVEHCLNLFGLLDEDHGRALLEHIDICSACDSIAVSLVHAMDALEEARRRRAPA